MQAFLQMDQLMPLREVVEDFFLVGQGDPCSLQIKSKTMASSVFMAELAALTMAAKVKEAMQIKTAIIATDSSESVRQLHTNQGTF